MEVRWQGIRRALGTAVRRTVLQTAVAHGGHWGPVASATRATLAALLAEPTAACRLVCTIGHLFVHQQVPLPPRLLQEQPCVRTTVVLFRRDFGTAWNLAVPISLCPRRSSFILWFGAGDGILGMPASVLRLVDPPLQVSCLILLLASLSESDT